MAFVLRFTPDADGPVSTAFTVTSNAESSPDTVQVRGSGKDVSSVRGEQVVPGMFTLYQNYPNPFRASTVVRYDLEVSSAVRLTVTNALGQLVSTLVNETQRPGRHTAQWTPGDRVPGVYFLVLHVGADQAYLRVVLN